MQDTVRIHHISLLHLIIERSICTMIILDNPGLLKVGSFGIHIPMTMHIYIPVMRPKNGWPAAAAGAVLVPCGSWSSQADPKNF